MSEYHFLKQENSGGWVILSPRRAKRPDASSEQIKICPFCPGRESLDPELYRSGGKHLDTKWDVRVIANKFPFGPSHEVIIHSQDHHKGIEELSLAQVAKLISVYKERFLIHQKEGLVYIFHNHGFESGQSQPHPHSQLVVIPESVPSLIPPLDLTKFAISSRHFGVFAPQVSQWPDEVWIAPKVAGNAFGDISLDEEHDLAFALQRVITILDLRHGHEFPYNFYIYPGRNWYIRVIPRVKTLGGFELGTGIYVNTQDPAETNAFLAEHFLWPDEGKIQRTQMAEYEKGV